MTNLSTAGIKDKEVFFKRGLMRLEEEDYVGALSDFENAEKLEKNRYLYTLITAAHS